MSIRTDSTRLDSTYFTSEGFIIDSPVVTRTGVFKYQNEDGSVRREGRLPEHVFCPKSLESYEGKDIILTHVTDKGGMVDSENFRQYSIGNIIKAYRDGENVRCKIIIKDVDALRQNPDLRELSLAYTPDMVKEAGAYNGEDYDELQTNIRINNLAIVAEARAGSHARLNIDGGEKMEEKTFNDKELMSGLLELATTAAKIGLELEGLSADEAKRKIVEAAMPEARLDGMCLDTLYALAQMDIAKRKPLSAQYEGIFRTDGKPLPGANSLEEARRKYEEEYLVGANIVRPHLKGDEN